MQKAFFLSTTDIHTRPKIVSRPFFLNICTASNSKWNKKWLCVFVEQCNNNTFRERWKQYLPNFAISIALRHFKMTYMCSFWQYHSWMSNIEFLSRRASSKHSQNSNRYLNDIVDKTFNHAIFCFTFISYVLSDQFATVNMPFLLKLNLIRRLHEDESYKRAERQWARWMAVKQWLDGAYRIIHAGWLRFLSTVSFFAKLNISANIIWLKWICVRFECLSSRWYSVMEAITCGNQPDTKHVCTTHTKHMFNVHPTQYSEECVMCSFIIVHVIWNGLRVQKSTFRSLHIIGKLRPLLCILKLLKVEKSAACYWYMSRRNNNEITD